MKLTANIFNEGASSRIGEVMQARFAEYLKETSKTLHEAVLHHVKEIAETFFLLTPRASAPLIRSKVTSLGWRFKRAPKKFAAKFRGKGGQEAKEADKLRKKIFDELGVRRRSRQKATDAFREAMEAKPDVAKKYIEALKLTLSEQREAAISIRQARIHSMASSWIPAMRKLGSKMNVASKKAYQKPYSAVTMEGSKIRVVNFMNGIVGLMERSGTPDAVFAARSQDLQAYLDKKRAGRMTIFNPSGNR